MAKKKAKSDPSKPKRPQSPFFLFMSDFRVRFKKENPHNIYVSVVGKAAGEKWKSMSNADKAPYIADAEKKKMEYTKAINAYNKKVLMACNNTNLVAGKKSSSRKSSVKSNSRVNDDDDDSDDDDDDDYDNEEEEEEDDEIPTSRTKKVKQMVGTSTQGCPSEVLEISISPSTSSPNESSLSPEIQVQSKPFGPQAPATLTQSLDSRQNYVGDVKNVQTVTVEKVPPALEVQPLPISDPVVFANPQTNVSPSVDVVMKDQVVIPKEMVTSEGGFQDVHPDQDPRDDLLHQVKQACNGDTGDADPADDLLSLLNDSSPTASVFAGLDSSDLEAMELFKELKRLMSKPLDVASADTSAFDQMRRLVEKLKPLKQRLPLSGQSTLEQVNNFLSLHASKNAFLTATLPVYEQAVNAKEDLVKKLLPLKEQKEKIVVNKKQQEAVKVKAEEKVEQLKKQLALAEAELAEANTGMAVFINSEKKRVDNINALRDEVNQTVKTLRNLQSDYELAVLTKKELEGLLLVITQSSSP